MAASDADPRPELGFQPPTQQEKAASEPGKQRRLVTWLVWLALLVGVGVGVLAVLQATGLVDLRPARGLGERIIIKRPNMIPLEVYYTRDTTEAEARSLGDFLTRAGFDGREGAAVRLSKDGDAYVVSFVLLAGAWDDPAVIAHFQTMRQSLSQEVFANQRVVIRLCDRWVSSDTGRPLPVKRTIE